MGESGSGKSVTCLSILRLVPEPAARIVAGQIMFDGEDLLKKSAQEMREIRRRKNSMILQDPLTSLNPVFTIGNQLAEAISVHCRLKGQALMDRARDMLNLVHIPSPEMRLRNYPHELSGGMRQRVAGAIAMSCEPQLLIADEPTTSLDVTLQDQYLDLLKELQKKAGLTLVFVTHDFGIVAKTCDKVAVMYAGMIVEMAGIRELFNHPLHPYTQALMKAVPKLSGNVARLASIRGQPPPLTNLPPGCRFAPRCSSVNNRCAEALPPLIEVSAEHYLSCWVGG